MVKIRALHIVERKTNFEVKIGPWIKCVHVRIGTVCSDNQYDFIFPIFNDIFCTKQCSSDELFTPDNGKKCDYFVDERGSLTGVS